MPKWGDRLPGVVRLPRNHTHTYVIRMTLYIARPAENFEALSRKVCHRIYPPNCHTTGD